MLVQVLIFLVVIVGLFWIAGAQERRRERSLREWVSRHPGASIFWPFKPEEHPEVPVARWIEQLTGRPPLGIASALRIRQNDVDVWWIEYRATPAGQESSQWFTLRAQQGCDPALARVGAEEVQPAARTLLPESGMPQSHRGLITVGLLESPPLGGG